MKLTFKLLILVLIFTLSTACNTVDNSVNYIDSTVDNSVDNSIVTTTTTDSYNPTTNTTTTTTTTTDTRTGATTVATTELPVVPPQSGESKPYVWIENDLWDFSDPDNDQAFQATFVTRDHLNILGYSATDFHNATTAYSNLITLANSMNVPTSNMYDSAAIAGATALVNAARAVPSPELLHVLVGGSPQIVLDAYALDNTIANKMIVYAVGSSNESDNPLAFASLRQLGVSSIMNVVIDSYTHRGTHTNLPANQISKEDAANQLQAAYPAFVRNYPTNHPNVGVRGNSMGYKCGDCHFLFRMLGGVAISKPDLDSYGGRYRLVSGKYYTDLPNVSDAYATVHSKRVENLNMLTDAFANYSF